MVSIALQDRHRFSIFIQLQTLCPVKPDRVADPGLINQRSGIRIEHLVSRVLVICLVPNLVDQHNVGRLKFHVLQLIYIFPGKSDVNLIICIDILVDLFKLIVFS